MVKLLIDVPQDTFDRLSQLSDSYKMEVTELAQDVLTVIGNEVTGIMRLSDQYIAPYKLTAVLYHIIGSGMISTSSIYHKILDSLDAKGRYIQDDLEINIDDLRIWINFSSLIGSDLTVDVFDITLKSSSVILTAQSHIERAELSEEMVDQLKHIVDNISNLDDIRLPDSLIESEHTFSVSDDEIITIQLDIYEEDIFYLPSIPEIDSLFQMIYWKAGINSN